MMQDQDNGFWWGHNAGTWGGVWAHNEILLDAYKQPWSDALPAIVRAIILRPECDAEARALGEATHRRFLAHFGLAANDTASPLLLLYDVNETENPFSLYDRSQAPVRPWPWD